MICAPVVHRLLGSNRCKSGLRVCPDTSDILNGGTMQSFRAAGARLRIDLAKTYA